MRALTSPFPIYIKAVYVYFFVVLEEDVFFFEEVFFFCAGFFFTPEGAPFLWAEEAVLVSFFSTFSTLAIIIF